MHGVTYVHSLTWVILSHFATTSFAYYIAWVEIATNERRIEINVYMSFFAVSTLVLVIGAALPGTADVDSRRILWTISVFVEVCGNITHTHIHTHTHTDAFATRHSDMARLCLSLFTLFPHLSAPIATVFARNLGGRNV
jgi:hypothetical protein